MPNENSRIDEFFASTGPLARANPSYVYRDAQHKMARTISDALKNEQKSIVIEASTGTGKTFAYLAAALLAKKKTIVSTATKTLQDQLYLKDLPVIVKAIEEFRGQKISALILKGRSNYVCLKKVDEKTFQSDLFASEKKQDYRDLRAWVKKTQTGDFSEMSHLPESAAIFNEFDARAEHCIGRACSFYNDCFVTRLRREAPNADLLIVNHALLCTDGAIRAKNIQNNSDDGMDMTSAITSQILPDFDLWIIDEAHAFADSATKNFGITISEGELRQLANDILYVAAFLGKKSKDLLEPIAREILLCFGIFIQSILSSKNSRSIRFLDGMKDDEQSAYDKLMEALRLVDVALIQTTQSEIEYASEIKILSRRVHDLFVQLTYIVKGAAEKTGYLIVAEKDSRGGSLCAWPINPGSILRTHLWDSDIPVVMTSATLSFNGSTQTFRRQIGLNNHDDSSSAELILPPIFDFENRSVLYVAKNLPNPNEPDFSEKSHDEIRFLVGLSGGGTLILFTSHRALTETHLALRDEFALKGLKVLKQGDAPKLSLLKEFVRADKTTGSVLFATHSFWEGVDIPGRALRMLIIDRLPFHSVFEPLFEARMNACKLRGGFPFQELALPDAALTLKQGLGRLLRKNDDAGVAAVLDSRLINKSYGRQILNSLVSMPLISKRADLADIWHHHIKKLLGEFDELT